MIGPDTTVDELLAQRPDARRILRDKGIDTCCGGALTLSQAAEVRGIPLPDLLTAVGGPEPLVRASDSVRAILAAHPATASVFEKRGLMGCGGAAGPDEPIDLFASVHRIDVCSLVRELDEAARRPPETRAATPQAPSAPLYPAFLRAALIATLTLGATFGAYNLLVIHLALGPVPGSHNWAHAGFQLWGFVLLFIMGVGLHAVPRFLGAELARPSLARAALWSSIAALVLVAFGRVGPALPGTAHSLALGALLELGAVAAFAIALGATFRRARPAPDPFHRFLAAGTLWWVVAAALLALGATGAVLRSDADHAARWNEALYAAALFGGTLSWIQGMFLRTGPVFLGLPPTRPLAVALAFWLGQSGALLSVVGRTTIGRAIAETLTDVGFLATSASVVSFAIAVRPFALHASSHAPGSDRDFGRIVRSAFGGSLLFALLATAYAVMDLVGALPDRLLYDGARHAFALGLVVPMIFGMAGRVVPIFGGAALRWPWARRWGVYLVLAGLVLREAQVIAVFLRSPWLLNVSGISGIVAGAGVCLASASILATLRSSAAAETAPCASDVAISGDTIVATLVAAHPEALPILIEAGFTPLANPILRRTMARAVSVRQACRMHHIDLGVVLARIRAACPHGAGPVKLRVLSAAAATPARLALGEQPNRTTDQ
ncbi:MAG: DUF542 domain-containing protein [Deltaproteobacteria bacterium]|nr:DUF542 domain-containing protein [Deltaproteobacteria bacterium]